MIPATLGRAALAKETRHRRALPNGFEFHRSDWMRGSKDAALSPTIFLVEQPPGSVLPPHFHRNNQFQVVVRGDGTLGPHSVGPGTVHYAGAYTGYGPLIAGADGLEYFTIRAVEEQGATFLPIPREQIRRGPRIQAHGLPHAALDSGALRDLEAPLRENLLASDRPSGPEAFALKLPPHELIAAPAARGAGQFQLLLAGSIIMGVEQLSRWESRYVPVGAAVQPWQAGNQGAHVLVLNLPSLALEYQSASPV